jgi:hypothetical protein
MATTLGGVTLPDPIADLEGHGAELLDVGGFLPMANGSVVYDYVTSRYRFHLTWRAISAANFAIIETRALIKTAQAYVPPESATSYSVFVVPDGFKWKSREIGTATPYYDVELTLEEVA